MPQPSSKLLQLQLVWFSIASSVLLYAAIAWFAIEPNPDPSTERLYGFVSNPLSFVLGIAALGAFFASFIIPGFAIRSRRTGERPGVSPPPAPSAFELPAEISTALIVRFALLEAPAVIGLVGAFLMQEWRFYLPFGLLSLLGLVLTFPTASLVRSLDESNR